MNDNELIAWEVVDNEYITHHVCLKIGTAKYLRDWCNAIDYNNKIDCYGEVFEDSMCYSVLETEVIVG